MFYREVYWDNLDYLEICYFWYLPFSSVNQCKYVIDKAGIGCDEWTSKLADLAEDSVKNTSCLALMSP